MVGLLLIALLGLTAQFVDGTVGMGFGAISATILLSFGFVPVAVSATLHIAKIFTGIASGCAHLFCGNVKRDWLLPLIVPGMVGGVAGALVLSNFPGEAMRPYIAIFLLLIGLLMLYRFFPQRSPVMGLVARCPKDCAACEEGTHSVRQAANGHGTLPWIGFVGAFLDAVGGGGWGVIATPGLILTRNAEPRKAVGTVNVAEIFIASAVSATFLVTFGLRGISGFDWKVVAAMVAGGLVAAPVAAQLCKRIPPRLLGISVGVVLVLVNLRTILLFFQQVS